MKLYLFQYCFDFFLHSGLTDLGSPSVLSIECSQHVIPVRISLEANGVKYNVGFEITLGINNRLST